MNKILCSVIGIFCLFLALPQDAYAIKAWATKYNVSCSTCHGAGGPTSLTPLGRDFLRRGHRMSDDEVNIGLDNLFSINTKFRAHDSNAPGRNSTFEVHAFSIYTGGMMSSHFSYFTEMYLYENTGKTSGPADSAYHSKLADAYIMWNSRPDKSSFTTVKFGQISSDVINLYMMAGPRYSETRPYIVNNSAVSPNGYKPFMRNFGVEIGQTVNRFHANLGVLNGTGASFTNSIDNNESKDVYASVDYDLDSQGSAVGVYGYKGRGLITPSTGLIWENDFHRVGVFGQYSQGRLGLTGAVTRGQEQVDALGAKTNNTGVLAGADWTLSDDLVVFGRYDYFDSNNAKANDQMSGPVFGLTYRLLETGRIVFQYSKQGKWVPTDKSKFWECRTELSFMF